MKMLKDFIGFYKPHRKLFYWDMVCAMVIALADLFYPTIARNIINVYVPNKMWNMFLLWSAVLLVIYLIKMGMNYFVQYYGHVMGNRLQGDMRQTVFHKLQKLPFSYFDENKSGTIMSRIINDLMDISELSHHGPEDLFISLVTLVGVFIVMSTVSLTLTLIIFATLPFVVWFTAKMRHKLNDAFAKSRVEMGEVNANLENAISGIRVSRSYTSGEHEEEKFRHYNQIYIESRNCCMKVMGQFGAVSNFMTDMMYFVVLVAGGAFYFLGKIDVGELMMFLLYVNTFLTPVRKLINFVEQFQNGLTGYHRFNEIMAQPEESEAPDAKELKNVKGSIDFDNVSFSYEAKNEDGKEHRSVISHMSMHIDPGKTVALVGPSGGGKTTVCNLIPRFYEVTGGKISIDGQDITTLSRLSLRRSIGMVAQDVFLFTGTIRENIAYGNLNATDEEIIAAAKKARCHDFIQRLPQGYDTVIGEAGGTLSGGERQRLSIARAMLKDAPIIILDEATANVDPENERELMEAIDALTAEKTVILIAHRLKTVHRADQILVLDRGRIVQRGTHDELAREDGLYRRFLTGREKAVGWKL
mgnify:CR=1 FL=1